MSLQNKWKEIAAWSARARLVRFPLDADASSPSSLPWHWEPTTGLEQDWEHLQRELSLHLSSSAVDALELAVFRIVNVRTAHHHSSSSSAVAAGLATFVHPRFAVTPWACVAAGLDQQGGIVMLFNAYTNKTVRATLHSGNSLQNWALLKRVPEEDGDDDDGDADDLPHDFVPIEDASTAVSLVCIASRVFAGEEEGENVVPPQERLVFHPATLSRRQSSSMTYHTSLALYMMAGEMLGSPIVNPATGFVVGMHLGKGVVGGGSGDSDAKTYEGGGLSLLEADKLLTFDDHLAQLEDQIFFALATKLTARRCPRCQQPVEEGDLWVVLSSKQQPGQNLVCFERCAAREARALLQHGQHLGKEIEAWKQEKRTAAAAKL